MGSWVPILRKRGAQPALSLALSEMVEVSSCLGKEARAYQMGLKLLWFSPILSLPNKFVKFPIFLPYDNK